jgi:hypothetical protein
MDTDLVVKLGAAYAALQAVAQAVMVIAPKHTIVFKVAKFIVAGPSRVLSGQ